MGVKLWPDRPIDDRGPPVYRDSEPEAVGHEGITKI